MKKLCFTIIVLLLVSHSKTTEATFLVGVSELRCKEYTTEEKLLKVFVESGVDSIMSKILVAQAVHESGRFTNSLTKKYRNVYALTECVKNCRYKGRKTLSLGGHGYAEGRYGYSTYHSIDSAAKDMLLYLEARKIPTTFCSVTEYSKFIKAKGYYEASESLYSKAVYAHYKKLWLN